MNHLGGTHGALAPDAARVLAIARARAARGRTRLDSRDLLEELVASPTSAGDALRRAGLTARSRALAPVPPAVSAPDVELADDLDEIFRFAAARARKHGAAAATTRDLAVALVVVPGPHTIDVGEAGAAVLDHIRAYERGTEPSSPPLFRLRGCLSLWSTVTLQVSAGAALLVFFPGVILHRGLTLLVSATRRHRPSFPSLLGGLGVPFGTDRCLSRRAYVWCTLGVRCLLMLIAVLVFLAVALEIHGLYVVPWPEIWNGMVRPGAGNLTIDIGASAVLGKHFWPLWVAVSAAYMAIPSVDEATRLSDWRRETIGDRGIVARLLSMWRRGTRIISSIDTAMSHVGLPELLGSGMIGVVSALVAGTAGARLILVFA